MANQKIAIFLNGNHGDVMTAMSVLKYKDIIWKDKDIVWFCSKIHSDVLKFAPVEVREWEDFTELIKNKKPDNTLRHDLKSRFSSLDDIDLGYFPAPWMYDPSDPNRNGIDYPNISKRIFGIDSSWEWHPMLYFSDEEREMVKDFCLKLPYKKTIMLETDCRSNQSTWDSSMTAETMKICREKFGDCNFIFASAEKDISKFLDNHGAVSCSHFTVRQTALVNNYSDLFIGLSSGISVATSCWGNKPTPKIQYTSNFTCSTVSLANGPIELIEIHATPKPKEKYYSALKKVLNTI